jgi:hypothetical protein
MSVDEPVQCAPFANQGSACSSLVVQQYACHEAQKSQGLVLGL